MNGAATTGSVQPVSLEAVTRAAQEIGLLERPTEWTLIAPDGRVWVGDVAHIFSALTPHHPPLKIGGSAWPRKPT